MRAIIAVAVVLPFLSCALELKVSAKAEEKVLHRLKAGKDLNPLRSAPKEDKKYTADGESTKLDLMENAEQVIEEAEVKVDPSRFPFRPRMEIIPSEWKVGKSSNIEVFWQRPKGEVKGIMFGATGCFHQGGDFFEQQQPDGWEFKECKDAKLTKCQGLPENVYFTKYALERNYLFMTITAQGKNSCWDHQLDAKRVNLALDYVLKKEALPLDTIMYASGASSGGQFMFDLQKAEIPNLKCIAPQLASIRERTHKEHLPTMMIYMPKDHTTSYEIQKSIDYLKHRLNNRVAVRKVHPWAVKDLMRARGFSDELVNETSHALQRAKGCCGHPPMTANGYIRDHPGTDDWWKTVLRKWFPHEKDSLVKDHSVMHHVMQAAFAEHEFTAEYTDQIIDFCESDGTVDPQTPLRFGRKVEGGAQTFDIKASGVHGQYEQ